MSETIDHRAIAGCASADQKDLLLDDNADYEKGRPSFSCETSRYAVAFARDSRTAGRQGLKRE